MMIIKYGDGKITSVIESDEELDEFIKGSKKAAVSEKREIVIIRDEAERCLDSHSLEKTKENK